MQSERNWNERNGTGDSTAVGAGGAASSVGGAGASGAAVLDWNGTPSSSPRKEFSSHNRNLENWRRNRNEDGSGDGPAPGNLTAIEVSGWRSGPGTHRWGKQNTEDSICIPLQRVESVKVSVYTLAAGSICESICIPLQSVDSSYKAPY